MEQSREDSIGRIKRTKLYVDGARFTTKDMVGRLNGRKVGEAPVTDEMVQKLCTVMSDRGLLTVHFKNNPAGGRTAKWSRSKGSVNWLHQAWRAHTDEQLGIRV